MSYLAHWPDLFSLAETPSGRMMGYSKCVVIMLWCIVVLILPLGAVMGKVEGKGENWHGHVTAVTVAPEFRRLGLAAKLMNRLEVETEVYEKMHCEWLNAN